MSERQRKSRNHATNFVKVTNYNTSAIRFLTFLCGFVLISVVVSWFLSPLHHYNNEEKQDTAAIIGLGKHFKILKFK